MKLPLPKYSDVKVEAVKWPTVDFDRNAAKAIARRRRKNKPMFKGVDLDLSVKS